MNTINYLSHIFTVMVAMMTDMVFVGMTGVTKDTETTGGPGQQRNMGPVDIMSSSIEDQ